jgi:hypothetical protein
MQQTAIFIVTAVKTSDLSSRGKLSTSIFQTAREPREFSGEIVLGWGWGGESTARRAFVNVSHYVSLRVYVASLI